MRATLSNKRGDQTANNKRRERPTNVKLTDQGRRDWNFSWSSHPCLMFSLFFVLSYNELMQMQKGRHENVRRGLIELGGNWIDEEFALVTDHEWMRWWLSEGMKSGAYTVGVVGESANAIGDGNSELNQPTTNKEIKQINGQRPGDDSCLKITQVATITSSPWCNWYHKADRLLSELM